MLTPFHAGQQTRIDPRRPKGVADLLHRAADGLEERSAGVFHQMPNDQLTCTASGQALVAAAP